MRTAADEFIAGKPAVYIGFDGNLYIATYFTGTRNKAGVGHLEVVRAGCKTKPVQAPLMSECQARSFFWNLDATAED